MGQGQTFGDFDIVDLFAQPCYMWPRPKRNFCSDRKHVNAETSSFYVPNPNHPHKHTLAIFMQNDPLPFALMCLDLLIINILNFWLWRLPQARA